MMTIFTLSSARSGTLYLRYLFQNNVKDCVCRHEPFFDWGNPTLFGPAIYDAYARRVDNIRDLLAKKLNYVSKLAGKVYLESSHAFLKSAYLAAIQIFPDLRLVHLIRDPLKVAKSEAYREEWRCRIHAPFHYYIGDDDRRHFYWSLTGNEEIFRHFDLAKLSLFQRYFVQWIEIENRAMSYLQQNNLNDRCVTLHCPEDLNNPETVEAMFNFFGLEKVNSDINFAGRKNRSLGRKSTVITSADEAEAQYVLERLPAHYLSIFQSEPYVGKPWNARLRNASRVQRLYSPSESPARTSLDPALGSGRDS